MAKRSLNAAAQNAQQDNAPNADASQEATPYAFVKVVEDQYGNFRFCNILQSRFVELLQSLGYRKYDKQDGSYITVRVHENIIEEVTVSNLRVETVKYFREIDEDDLMEKTGCPKHELIEKLYRSLGTLLSEEKLSLLVDFEKGNVFNIISDTLDKAYYFYQNGFVEVTRSGVKLRPYSELPGVVWKDQILPRNFTKMDTAEIEKGYFYKFLKNVAENKEASKEVNEKRLLSLQTIGGYNLHRYFNTNLRATILLDARTSDDPDGRSGKSLWCKALRYIMNADPENGSQCKIIDGKTFLADNRFKFEELAHNTRLCVFDDVKRGTQIEDFFNAIPDGISVERKSAQGKERVHAKIIFTLNYTLTIRGGSAKDRVVEFEFADYYSSKFKPEHEFKHWFFRDWDAEEWGRFDNLMMCSVEQYFVNGITDPEIINLDARKLKNETNQDFVNFMLDLNISHEQRFVKADLFAKFVDLDDHGKIRNKDFDWMTKKKFTGWLQRWAEYRPEIAGYRSVRSNSTDYIIYFYNSPLSAEHIGAEGVTLYDGKSDKCIPASTYVLEAVQKIASLGADEAVVEDENAPF